VSSSRKIDPLNNLAKYATIIAALVAIAALPYIVINMNISMQQLYTNIENTEKLAKLIDSSINQTKAVENLLLEIQHQTVVNAYNAGGNFTVKITHCGSPQKTEADGTELGYFMSFKPVMITESGVETTVPFRIFADLEFKEKENQREGLKQSYFEKIKLNSYQHNPAKSSGIIEVHVQDILDKAEELGFKYVHVDYEFSFRPYSPAMDDNSFADQTEDRQLAIKLWKLHDNGKWHPEDFEEQYVCRG